MNYQKHFDELINRGTNLLKDEQDDKITCSKIKERSTNISKRWKALESSINDLASTLDHSTDLLNFQKEVSS